jgi:hypothetical protein
MWPSGGIAKARYRHVAGEDVARVLDVTKQNTPDGPGIIWVLQDESGEVTKMHFNYCYFHRLFHHLVLNA